MSSDKYTFDVQWKAFMLRSDFPKEGVSKEDFMASRYGSVAAYQEQVQKMIATFADEGIEFKPEGQKTGSSVNSHRITAFATLHGKQNEIVEELFRMYITDQMWVGDVDTCVKAAVNIGLDAVAAAEYMKDDNAGMAEVRQDLALGQQLRVSGVPFFVIGDKAPFVGLSGAQGPEAFIEAFEQVAADLD